MLSGPDINLSQGSISTLLRCGGIINYCFATNLLLVVERILKIGQHLTDLRGKKRSCTFLAETVYIFKNNNIDEK